jgi:hypothetical protein
VQRRSHLPRLTGPENPLAQTPTTSGRAPRKFTDLRIVCSNVRGALAFCPEVRPPAARPLSKRLLCRRNVPRCGRCCARAQAFGERFSCRRVHERDRRRQLNRRRWNGSHRDFCFFFLFCNTLNGFRAVTGILRARSQDSGSTRILRARSQDSGSTRILRACSKDPELACECGAAVALVLGRFANASRVSGTPEVRPLLRSCLFAQMLLASLKLLR